MVTTQANGTVTHAPSTPAALIAELSALFFERESAIKAIVIGAVAGCHSFVIGPPGTAKSDLARALASSFEASYFEYLMTRFTVPDEVFGPVKLSGLQKDEFSRQHKGFLPTAEIAFLDEIWKSNSAILNALLTITNEGIIHDNGAPVRVPLLSLIAASNELPESAELDAIYDRFMVRVAVDYISDDHSFRAMLTSAPVVVRSRVDIRAEQALARAVTVSDDTLSALCSLRTACRTAGVVVSDRRWRKCLSLVKAAAHVDGRAVTEPDDLEILECALWRKPDERVAVARVIQSTINPAGAKAVAEMDAAREIARKVRPAPKDPREVSAWSGEMASSAKDIREILARLSALPSGRKVDEARKVAKEIQASIVGAITRQATGA